MNFLKITLLLLAACTLFACKKTKKTTPVQQEPAKYADYTKLKPGNYWVYAEYVLDTNGLDSATGYIDSSYVRCDTLINGKTYHILVTNMRYMKLEHILRDSLSYTVDQDGQIFFSSTDFTSIFYADYFDGSLIGPEDTVGYQTRYMSYKDVPLLTPAGVFKTSSFVTEWDLHPYYAQYAGKRRFYRYAYAENIGLVQATSFWFFLESRSYEERLLRYHVE